MLSICNLLQGVSYQKKKIWCCVGWNESSGHSAIFSHTAWTVCILKVWRLIRGERRARAKNTFSTNHFGHQKKGPDEAHSGMACEMRGGCLKRHWACVDMNGWMDAPERARRRVCVFMFVRVHADGCERHVRCMCMRAQSQASVCSQQKHSFLFLEKLLWKTKCLVRFLAQGSLTPASPKRSSVLTIPPPFPITTTTSNHHHHPTLSSAAHSHSCNGNSCPVLSPAVLWDQM